MPAYYDRRFWDYTSAAYYRLRKAIGIKPWDKIFQINFWGPTSNFDCANDNISGNERKSRWYASLGPLYSVFKGFQKTDYVTYTAENIVSKIADYQPEVLRGNPSYLRLVAEMMTDMGIKEQSLKLLLCGGEVLDEPTRKFLELSFNSKVFDAYWANEVGSISWECKKREGQHVSAALLILEVIQDGEPVSPGEKGEIVVTCLLNYAMPFNKIQNGRCRNN